MPDQSQIANRKSQILSWHGLSLTVPATWNPVKLDGDFTAGSLLLADLSAARLGIRWRTAGRGDPKAWADRALRDELGAEAADAAKDIKLLPADAWRITRLSINREPPGRDVFVGWSERTNRVIEIVYNVAERDDVLRHKILPTLSDTPADAEQTWAIFGLKITTPPQLKMHSFALNAGDLSMTFLRGRARTTVRRIGPASLALSRRPLEQWLITLDKAQHKMYRPPVETTPITLAGDDRTLRGMTATIRRRLRLFWAWFVPKQLTAVAIHDEENNRLLIGTSDDEQLLRRLLSEMSGPIEPPIEIDGDDRNVGDTKSNPALLAAAAT